MKIVDFFEKYSYGLKFAVLSLLLHAIIVLIFIFVSRAPIEQESKSPVLDISFVSDVLSEPQLTPPPKAQPEPGPARPVPQDAVSPIAEITQKDIEKKQQDDIAVLREESEQKRLADEAEQKRNRGKPSA